MNSRKVFSFSRGVFFCFLFGLTAIFAGIALAVDVHTLSYDLFPSAVMSAVVSSVLICIPTFGTSPSCVHFPFLQPVMVYSCTGNGNLMCTIPQCYTFHPPFNDT